MTDTANAPERIWTADTTGNCSVGFNTPSLDYKNEYISRTHCDELVAAAYLDAGWRIEQCLWSYHWYLDGESVDPEDLSRGIIKRTPDDARAALTAYGERMKADLAEAQAKDAPVRHWVRRYYHQDDGNGFGAITGSEWVEVYPPERRTDFRDALIKELVATVDWYADQFCEGLCHGFPLSFTTLEMERDCGGCRARAALGKAKEAGYDAE